MFVQFRDGMADRKAEAVTVGNGDFAVVDAVSGAASVGVEGAVFVIPDSELQQTVGSILGRVETVWLGSGGVEASAAAASFGALEFGDEWGGGADGLVGMGWRIGWCGRDSTGRKIPPECWNSELIGVEDWLEGGEDGTRNLGEAISESVVDDGARHRRKRPAIGMRVDNVALDGVGATASTPRMG